MCLSPASLIDYLVDQLLQVLFFFKSSRNKFKLELFYFILAVKSKYNLVAMLLVMIKMEHMVLSVALTQLKGWEQCGNTSAVPINA